MTVNELGDRISMYRQNMNMTQEELAARIGVTPQAVSKWERSQSLPDVNLLTDLCTVLHVSADALLNLSPEPAADTEDKSRTDILRQLQDSLLPLELIFGKNLVPVFAEQFSPELVKKQRLELAKDGILLPVIRIYDYLSLEPDEFMIISYNRILYSERIEHTDEHTCKYIIEKLAHTAKTHYGDVLSHDLVKQLTDNLKTAYPALVEGIIPDKISYGLLQEVLKGFVQRGNSPRYLPKIIEIMESALREQPELTSERLIEIVAGKLECGDTLTAYLHRKSPA